jgi:hypothetical protein
MSDRSKPLGTSVGQEELNNTAVCAKWVDEMRLGYSDFEREYALGCFICDRLCNALRFLRNVVPVGDWGISS